MSESSICPHARQAARDAFRDELEYPDIPEQLPTPGTDQAQSLEAALKPYFYGKLGQAIGLISTQAMLELPPERLNWRGFRPWERLGHETERHLENARKVIQKDGAYDQLFGELEVIHGVKKQLRPKTYSSLENLIDDGARTYSDTALLTLKQMHESSGAIRKPHRPIDVIRKSSNQLRDLASVNIAQFSALRYGIHRSRMPEQQFNRQAGILQLQTALPDIPMDDIYHGLYVNNLPNGEVARSVADIGSKDPTIGCPILLTPKLVNELWEYTIDSAADRRLI